MFAVWLKHPPGAGVLQGPTVQSNRSVQNNLCNTFRQLPECFPVIGLPWERNCDFHKILQAFCLSFVFRIKSTLSSHLLRLQLWYFDALHLWLLNHTNCSCACCKCEHQRTSFLSLIAAECDGFECDNDQCIHNDQVCDNIENCPNGEDERPKICFDRDDTTIGQFPPRFWHQQ